MNLEVISAIWSQKTQNNNLNMSEVAWVFIALSNLYSVMFERPLMLRSSRWCSFMFVIMRPYLAVLTPDVESLWNVDGDLF